MKFYINRKFIILALISAFFLIYVSCTESRSEANTTEEHYSNVHQKDFQNAIDSLKVVYGDERMGLYIPMLDGKRVGLVINHTSMIGKKNLLDSLLLMDVNVSVVFAPEHGFRGDADAGAHIKNGIDEKTKVPIVSIYGEKKAPSKDDLSKVDIIIFDIQDVGARFYTFISTMHHVMQSCADANIPMLILDRPNPNGHYIDGPVLDLNFQSFVGMHPIPVVHGLTVGELGLMINGEGWLKEGAKCDLKVIECKNYSHADTYDLPIKPSPNLPNLRAILLYPSLCFFEGTQASIGRGTNQQFQIIGHPKFSPGSFTFTPKPMDGAKSPKLNGELCYGTNLSSVDPAQIKSWGKLNLSYLVNFQKVIGEDFINRASFFDKLAGTDQLRKDIEAGLSEEDIRAKWSDGLEKYKAMREGYLLYD